MKEHNAWLHLAAMCAVISLGFALAITRMEWIAAIVCIGMVLSAEAMNTAVEQICNYIKPEQDIRIMIIKDIAAAAVLILSITAAIVGMIIFGPKIYTLL